MTVKYNVADGGDNILMQHNNVHEIFSCTACTVGDANCSWYSDCTPHASRCPIHRPVSRAACTHTHKIDNVGSTLDQSAFVYNAFLMRRCLSKEVHGCRKFRTANPCSRVYRIRIVDRDMNLELRIDTRTEKNPFYVSKLDLQLQNNKRYNIMQ